MDMFEYEKPVIEIIDLQPIDKMMNDWDDEEDEWGSNEDLE